MTDWKQVDPTPEPEPNRWRHAPGFGAYTRATSERPHPVTRTYRGDDGARYCSECAYLVKPTGAR